MRLFSNFLNKTLSSIVSLALVVTSIPLTVPRVMAAPVCNNAYSADAGQAAGCAGTRIGGVPIGYQKLDWQRVSDMPLAASPGSSTVAGGDEAILLANRSAAAMGLKAADVASAVSLFPANVPYIFARYNPLDGTLRVDIFKLEKTVENGVRRAGVYRATFTPSNGDFWKASRSYIHPDAYKAGNTPGVNPFARFIGGDDYFHGIGMAGAQVAIGHAMRYAGAPLAVLQVAETRTGTETQKSGNAFRKKVTTIVNGFAKPRWFIAQPAAVMQRSTTMPMASLCAPDPTRVSCAVYETATSGVSFEEFDGGMLSNAEEKWELDRQTKSGWGFLAILVVAVVASFALAAIAPALGLASSAAAGATAVGAPAAGMMGSLLTAGGVLGASSSILASVALETAVVGSGMALLGGGNLGGMYSFQPSALLGVMPVAKATVDAVDTSVIGQKLNAQVAPRTTSDFAQGGGTLAGFQATVVGNCPVGSTLASCAGATGVVQHMDQYSEQNMYQFVRDNSGQIVRDATH
jgi:hypothetical protein